jgi:hypothetical protein
MLPLWLCMTKPPLHNHYRFHLLFTPITVYPLLLHTYYHLPLLLIKD